MYKCKDECKKLIIPVKLLYKHFGSDFDFPMRIVCSPSSHFISSGCGDIDIVVPSMNNDGNSNGSSGVNLEFILILKYFSKDDLNSFHLAHNSSLCFNICSSIQNSLGRQCWRDCGMCYVSLVELFGNRILSLNTSNSNNEENTFWTMRKIYNSAYGVKNKDKLTGILCVSLGKIYDTALISMELPKWFMETTFKLDPDDNFSIGVLFSRKNKNTDIFAKKDIHTKSNVFRSLEYIYSLLFSLKLEENRTLSNTYQEVSTFDFKLRNLQSTKTGISSNESVSFCQEVERCNKTYKNLLSEQDKLIQVDDRRISNMKCPWCPMDACVWEMFSDYSEEYITIKHKDNKLMKEKDHIHREERLVILNENYIQNHIVKIPNKSINMRDCDHRIWKDDNESSQRTWSFKFNQLFNLKPDKGDDSPHIAVDYPEKRFYLPFFSYLLFQPLSVYNGYWNRVLDIHCQRKGFLSIDKYFENKWKSNYNLQKKAAEAFQMILSYTQSIEYISDYHLPKKNRKNKTTKNVDDGRIEVEQFWNSLRAMCGDCDDLTLGNAQFYRAFTHDSWFDLDGTNVEISSHQILKEMRDILTSNYTLMFNIDAVNIPKQKFSDIDDASEDNKMEHTYNHKDNSHYYNISEEFAEGDYFKDTKDTNSAHACLKLIPKLYFERCVNRSCTSSQSPIFSKECSDWGSNCCFYHKHAPDFQLNDTLPVLFGEGTSMLYCSDEMEYNYPDMCKEDRFKEMIYEDENEEMESGYMDMVSKSIIYAEKGKSNFYKGALFGATLDFLQNHKVATFTYARIKKESNRIPTFLKGISHHQLSYKSESVCLVPYGHNLIDTIDNVNNRINPSLCTSIAFKSVEVTPFMYQICLNASKKRIRARKIRNPDRDIYMKDVPTSCRSYCTITEDTSHSIVENEKLLNTWCNKMNNVHMKTLQDTWTSDSAAFHLFFDNFYLNNETLERLTHRIEKAHKLKLEIFTRYTLERFSQDIQIWRISFNFHHK